MRHFQLLFVCLLVLSHGLISNNQSFAAAKRQVVNNPSIKMVIIPRTSQQMAAFYEGREFPANAIEATRSVCFFTIGIHNKSKAIIWHDTQQWQLNSKAGKIDLISKKQWRQRWKQLNLPQRFQSTFRWTLLPKQLDFQPGEREGGNITIPRQAEPFDLTAHFLTGENKNGKPIALEFKNLRCAKDSDQ